MAYGIAEYKVLALRTPGLALDISDPRNLQDFGDLDQQFSP